MCAGGGGDAIVMRGKGGVVLRARALSVAQSSAARSEQTRRLVP